ncbi:MAG: hypothetical protein C5B59_14955 [Bacteroidetes bacterium]|nr:MAG: hypothetical protein C5B59_14955 [Bacteroidota bacterium]
MFKKVIKKTRDLYNLPLKINKIKVEETYDHKNPKVLNGRTLANLNNFLFKQINKLSDVEFQVYSQWGDDGIIQWLIQRIEIPHKTFIEFGVQNYTESNTRFLLVNNNWEGLVLDGGRENIEYIVKDMISNFHHIHARCAFITKENINDLLSHLPFGQEVGILSIDIDGNDYWVWKEINVIQPVILIMEYNAHFKLNPWTIPYQADFVREVGNFKMNYWGASLQSLYDLSKEKGYSFVGCNSAGNNAYFVRNDKLGTIKAITPAEGYEFAKFRETRNAKGEWISDRDRLQTMKNLEVYNTQREQLEKIG